jgi:hypothetical protein
MEAAGSSEMLVPVVQFTQRRVHGYRRDNLKIYVRNNTGN